MVKKKEQILKLLEVVWIPKEVAILYYKGHQKGNNPLTQGNQLAGEAARAAGSKDTGKAPSLTMALTSCMEAPTPK